MRWYADNSELNGIREAEIPDILLFGGFVISGKEEGRLRDAIEGVKEKYGVRRAPVKWNFKGLKGLYEKQGQMDLYDRLLRSSKEWREEILVNAADYDIKIIISCLQTHSIQREVIKDVKQDLSGYVFANGLMRFALYVKDSKPDYAQVVLDWPDKGEPRPFDREYAWAFSKGKSRGDVEYFSGPLKELGFLDSVGFTTMNHSTLLQMADVVLGATRELIECALGKRTPGLGVDSLKKLHHRFLGAPNDIFGRGVNVSGDEKFSATIRDYVKATLTGQQDVV